MDQTISQKDKIFRYFNGRKLIDHQLRKEDLWVKNGKIISPQKMADFNVDVKGLIIAPGYIDAQINGGFGVDFSSHADKVADVVKQLPRYGVTSFLPTLVSMKKKDYLKQMRHLQPKQGGAEGSSILGIHLEGPFFNASQYGAHNLNCLADFNEPIESYYGSLSGVKLITLAPELPGALKAIQYLNKKNIKISVGHSKASLEQMEKAISCGVSMVTHLFNAMAPFHHRDPGIIGTILDNDSLFYSVIADGVHVHPIVLKIAWKANPKGLFLVTDAMEALGLSAGSYHLGQTKIDVQGKSAFISGTNRLAGSLLTMDKAVQFFYSSTGCKLEEALEAASLKPACALGIDHIKGKLNENYDADFILVDDHLNVRSSFIANQLAWMPENCK